MAHDVIVIGGGIGGAALATGLARDGVDVLVLEATDVFADRVRGESMQPWGVHEAQRLAVADTLVDAGAHTTSVWARYAEGDVQPREIPVGLMVAGVAGTLNLHHPTACQALLDAAESAGATVHRGVRDVEVEPGARPVVRWGAASGEQTSSRATVVVGADGRASAVRRCAGIRLDEQQAMGFIAGLLLDDVALSPDRDIVAEHERGLFLLFHQMGGRARAYHVVGPSDRARYAGADGTSRFVADAATSGVPGLEALATARPAGPTAAFPGTDTWTERPYADGVVLIGDAAGHNDPTAGCGLSIAMRDARIVRDLIVAGASMADDFTPYGSERVERMRRLRLVADLVNVASVEPAPNRSARRKLFAQSMEAFDAQIFPVMLGMFAGPETIPDHLVDDAVLDRIRSA